MAFEPSPNDTPEPEEDRGSLPGALVKQGGVGLLRGVVAPVVEAGNFLSDGQEGGVGDRAAQISRGIATAIEGQIPESRRKDAEASFFPDENKGEQSVFKNPISSISQKAVGMLPPMAATIAAPGLGAQAGLGAILGGGGFATQIKTKVENSTDEQLMQEYPQFADSVGIGMPSEYARRLLVRKLVSAGAVTATVGGGVGGAVMGGAGRPAATVARSMIKGAAEGAVGTGIQAGATDLATQEGEIDTGGRTNIDVVQALKASINPALEGGIIGTGMAAVHATKGRERPKKPVTDVEQIDGHSPTQEQQTALAPDKLSTEPPTPDQPVTPPGKAPDGAGLTMDERVAQAEAAQKASQDGTGAPTDVSRETPAQGAPVVEAPPTAPVAPPVASPVAAAGAPDLSTVREAIHMIATKNTPLTKLHSRLIEEMRNSGEAIPSQGDVLKMLQEMAKTGEIIKGKTGWRTSRKPSEPVAPPVVEKPTAPEIRPPEITASPDLARSVGSGEEGVVPTGNEGKAGGRIPEAPVASTFEASPNVKRVGAKDKAAVAARDQERIEAGKLFAPPKTDAPKVDTVAGQESTGAASKPKSMREELTSLQGKTDPESVARREVIEARFKSAADRAELLGKPKVSVDERLAAAEAATGAKAEPAASNFEPSPAKTKPAKVKKTAAEKKAKAVEKIVETSGESEADYAKRVETFKAEQAAARVEAKASGKPFVFKSVPKRGEGLTREAAVAKVNETQAEAAVRRRHEDNVKNNTAAEEVVRDTYFDGDNKPLVEDIQATEKAARGGDLSAIQKVVARAAAMVQTARDKGVELKRAPSSKLAPDTRNLTPHASYLRDAELFVKNVQTINGGKDSIAKKRAEIAKLVDDHIYQEEMLRAGKHEEAAERRHANNAELRAIHGKTTGDEGTIESLAHDRSGEAQARAKRVIKSDNQGPILTVRGNEIRTREDGRTEAPKVAAPRDGANTADILPNHTETQGFWNTVNAAKAVPASELVKPSDFGKDRVGKRLSAIVSKIMTHAGNVKVVILADRAFERSASKAQAGGVSYYPTDEAFFRGNNGLVVIRQSQANSHLVMHEVTHAATARLISTDPVFRGKIRDLMEEVKEHWVARSSEGDEQPYGFKNEHEFIAEALSNPDFQDFLQTVELSKPTTTVWGKITNPWLKLVQTIGRRLGIYDRSSMNALDAALRAGNEAMEQQTNQQLFRNGDVIKGLSEEGRLGGENRMELGDAREKLQNYWQERKPSLSEWKTRKQGFLNKILSLTQHANQSGKDYGAHEPAKDLATAMGKMFTDKETIRQGDRKLISDVFGASRKYGGGEEGSLWDRFEKFLVDETSAGAFADKDINSQTHLGKNDPAGFYAKEQHPELAARWDALTKEQPELAGLRGRVHDYFRERQNAVSLELIKNELRAMDPLGKGSDALAQRIHEGKITDADKAVLGEGAGLAQIKKAGALAKVDGPYVPLMRRGDYVVQGRHEIAAPSGVRRMDVDETANPAGKTFEFKTADEAKAFVKTLPARPESVERVYVDPDTGSRYYEGADGKSKRLGSGELNAEERYRVTANDQHVEFFERQQHAKDRRVELIKHGLKDVKDVDLRRLNASDVGADFMPTQITKMINDAQKRTAFKKLSPEAQHAYLQQLREAGLASMSSTRAQTRALPRRAVAGASEDITRGLQTYSSSSAGYLSRLKHQPKVDAILKDMQKYVDENPYAGNGDDTQVLRRKRLQEFERRVYSSGDYEPTTFFGKATSRLLQISYLDKLASPAFHIINSMEPWTVSFPTLSGRHGVFNTVRALHDAYKLIGARDTVSAGIKDTFKAALHDDGLTDYSTAIADRVRKVDPDAARMLDHLHDIGLISRNAGMELSRLTDPGSSLLGRGLDRADLMARQLGTAVESINRTVTALAAYKLERTKGANHDAALKYATEQTHDTMGDYAGWNAAPIFNHPLGRLMLQFRKYAQKTYYLLGKQATAALKGDTEAMKSFTGLMATHFMVAGALGLPLEPIKLGMLAAGMAGLTDKKYGDLEQTVRSGAASVFGVPAAEIFTRGLPRFLGVDLANRMGLDNLLTSNMDPKSMKTDDLYAYFAKNFAGAPASYLLDAVQGFQAAGRGDILEATRLLTPIKLYADSVQAYQMATSGKTTASGKQVMEPIGLGQAAVKALGFTPGAVAEQQEQAFATRGDISARTQKRSGLISQWVNASPGDKATRYRDVTDYNKSVPKDAQISQAQLSQALQRRKTDERSSSYSKGIKFTKQTKDLQSANDIYNTH